MLKIGIIGCGAIGSLIAKAMDGKINALFDISEKRAIELAENLKYKPKIARTFDEFVSSDINIVVESASQEAVRSYAERILKSCKDLMVLSVGALDEKFLSRLEDLAFKQKRKIYIPSGAIVGIDGIKAASILNPFEVTLTTKKNPKSFGLDISERRILFEGKAKDAVKEYPQNINVAATVSLAGIGFNKTKVKIIADPDVEENIHEIRISGSFGEIIAIAKNKKINNKTSYLAALSAIKMLKNMENVVVIGT